MVPFDAIATNVLVAGGVMNTWFWLQVPRNHWIRVSIREWHDIEFVTANANKHIHEYTLCCNRMQQIVMFIWLSNGQSNDCYQPARMGQPNINSTPLSGHVLKYFILFSFIFFPVVCLLVFFSPYRMLIVPGDVLLLNNQTAFIRNHKSLSYAWRWRLPCKPSTLLLHSKLRTMYDDSGLGSHHKSPNNLFSNCDCNHLNWAFFCIYFSYFDWNSLNHSLVDACGVSCLSTFINNNLLLW